MELSFFEYATMLARRERDEAAAAAEPTGPLCAECGEPIEEVVWSPGGVHRFCGDRCYRDWCYELEGRR